MQIDITSPLILDLFPAGPQREALREIHLAAVQLEDNTRKLIELMPRKTEKIKASRDEARRLMESQVKALGIHYKLPIFSPAVLIPEDRQPTQDGDGQSPSGNNRTPDPEPVGFGTAGG